MNWICIVVRLSPEHFWQCPFLHNPGLEQFCLFFPNGSPFCLCAPQGEQKPYNGRTVKKKKSPTIYFSLLQA
jgi:hypothetical protein